MTFTDRLKAEREVPRCRELDFIISEFYKRPRISELLHSGIWIPVQRRRSHYAFHFQKQAGIHGTILTYIIIVDAMVNKWCTCSMRLPFLLKVPVSHGVTTLK